MTKQDTGKIQAQEPNKHAQTQTRADSVSHRHRHNHPPQVACSVPLAGLLRGWLRSARGALDVSAEGMRMGEEGEGEDEDEDDGDADVVWMVERERSTPSDVGSEGETASVDGLEGDEVRTPTQPQAIDPINPATAAAPPPMSSVPTSTPALGLHRPAGAQGQEPALMATALVGANSEVRMQLQLERARQAASSDRLGWVWKNLPAQTSAAINDGLLLRDVSALLNALMPVLPLPGSIAPIVAQYGVGSLHELLRAMEEDLMLMDSEVEEEDLMLMDMNDDDDDDDDDAEDDVPFREVVDEGNGFIEDGADGDDEAHDEQ